MKIIILLLSILLLACTTPKIEIPTEILSETAFESILKEIHLAEAIFELNKNNGMENATNELANSCFHIYKKHKISEKNFKETLNYYSENSEKLEKIYTNVLEQLTKEKSKLDLQ